MSQTPIESGLAAINNARIYYEVAGEGQPFVMVHAGDFDLLAEIETQIWFDGMGRSPDQVNQAMRRLAYEMNRTALSHYAQKLGKQLPDTEITAVDHLSELQIPTLVIVGAHDIRYIQAAADYMVEKIPSARKAVIEDAAHLSNMDQPDEFGEIVIEFLMASALLEG
jgi:3-oxoadipate enol-lactonase